MFELPPVGFFVTIGILSLIGLGTVIAGVVWILSHLAWVS